MTDVLTDESRCSILSRVTSEIEISVLAFVYGKRIIKGASVSIFKNILFPPIIDPQYTNEWTLPHNRLFSLVERTCDYTQKTAPETVQTLAQAIAHLTDWKNDDSAYIFYRDDDDIKEKSDALVQRVDCPDSTTMCYLQAPVVLQRCLIAKYRQNDGPFEMIDIKKFVSNHLTSDQLLRHFYMQCCTSMEIMRSILAPDSHIELNGFSTIDPSFMKKYGPGLITGFRVHSDFLDESVLVHSGLATGTFVGCHSMLLVGVKGSGESKIFMLQNWWRRKQFVQVSTSYLADCFPLIYFVRTPQTEIDKRYPVVYGGYAESGGVDAEDCKDCDDFGDDGSESGSSSEPFEE